MKGKKEIPESIKRYCGATFPGFFVVTRLNAGDTFGELSLKMNEPRTATVIASKGSKYGVLTK
jgi:CRP-like cAMP-binding protein